uniref:BPTI/Kunitz domain-containing protein 4-like n=1 Tax=Crassostrea virginica TaxID=6565 RepID=A0A8B8EHX7_CRAVI|nr:BPTI/Kunitz domain-containing protein 4-like [Crassostrea virginica]
MENLKYLICLVVLVVILDVQSSESRSYRRCGPVCAIFCPNGNVLDKFGCPTCRCKPPICPLVLCARPCPNGVIVDKNGCSTCRCKPDNTYA